MKILIILSVFMLTSCSSSFVKENNFEPKTNFKIAFLPLINTTNLRPQRVNLINRVVSAKLKNLGYFILDGDFVQNACASLEELECRQRLAKFEIDAYLKLEITDNTLADIGLINYNSLSANSELLDLEDNELFQARASEKESGGLLLNSGQVISALNDLYLHSSDIVFARLVTRLVDSLYDELPHSSYMKDQKFRVDIDSTNVDNIGNNFNKVCLRGTPNSFAYLIVNRKKTNLREISSGYYCGSYYKLDKALEVELKNPYGFSKRSRL